MIRRVSRTPIIDREVQQIHIAELLLYELEAFERPAHLPASLQRRRSQFVGDRAERAFDVRPLNQRLSLARQRDERRIVVWDVGQDFASGTF